MSKITDKQVAAGWLAGLIDGEGCVYYRRGKRSSRVVTIGMTDKECIDAAANCFDLLGIKYTRSDRKATLLTSKHIYTIEVRRAADMQRIYDLIPIQHIEKIRKLKEALSFVRGLRCKACNCLFDEKTVGCIDCRKRHELRIKQAKRYQQQKALLQGADQIAE